MIVFEIRGQPMGKQRPKFTRAGGFVRAYTPKETVEYENKVRNAYLEQSGESYEDEPLCMLIKAFYEVPKSYSFKKKFACLRGEIRPTTKPDADNIAKIIADAVQGEGLAFHDDKQIVDLYIEKYYSIEPRVRVMIGSVGEIDKGGDE